MARVIKKFTNSSNKQLFEIEYEKVVNGLINIYKIYRITVFNKDNVNKPMITGHFRWLDRNVPEDLAIIEKMGHRNHLLTKVETYTEGVGVDPGYTGPTAVFNFEEPMVTNNGTNDYHVKVPCTYNYIMAPGKYAYSGDIIFDLGSILYFSSSTYPNKGFESYKEFSSYGPAIYIKHIHIYSNDGTYVTHRLKQVTNGKYKLSGYNYINGSPSVSYTYEFDSADLLADLDTLEQKEAILKTYNVHTRELINTLTTATRTLQSEVNSMYHE